MKKLSLSTALGIILLPLASVAAQTLSYSSVGSTYSQDFNSLTTNSTVTNSTGGVIFAFNDSTQINATNMAGWYGEAASKTVYTNGSGGASATTGAFYDFAVAGAQPITNEALGLQTTTATGPEIFGLVISNTTGMTLTNFTIDYNAEYWHNGTATTAKTLAFGYIVGGGSTLPTISTNGTITPASGSYVHDATLDYTQAGTGTAGALDGHAAGNNTDETDTLSVSWAPNTTLWLVWSVGSNNAQSPGLAIDNVTFSAVPEPSSYALFLGGIALLAGVVIRRTRSNS
jgi:hypothetical protein